MKRRLQVYFSLIFRSSSWLFCRELKPRVSTYRKCFADGPGCSPFLFVCWRGGEGCALVRERQTARREGKGERAGWGRGAGGEAGKGTSATTIQSSHRLGCVLGVTSLVPCIIAWLNNFPSKCDAWQTRESVVVWVCEWHVVLPVVLVICVYALHVQVQFLMCAWFWCDFCAFWVVSASRNHDYFPQTASRLSCAVDCHY